MFFFRARAKKVIASFIAWHIDASSVVWTLKDFCFSNVLMLCYKLFNHVHLNASNKHFKDIKKRPSFCLQRHKAALLTIYRRLVYIHKRSITNCLLWLAMLLTSRVPLVTKWRPLFCVFEMSVKRIFVQFWTTSRFILRQLDFSLVHRPICKIERD